MGIMRRAKEKKKHIRPSEKNASLGKPEFFFCEGGLNATNHQALKVKAWEVHESWSSPPGHDYRKG